MSTDLAVRVDPTWNITDLIMRTATQRPTRVVFSRPEGDGLVDVTAAEFAVQCTDLAKGLIGSGVGLGDRVAIMSRTRYEWTLCDAAIWFAGAVSVPVYETSSVAQVRWILSDSDVHAIFVETPELADRVREALQGRELPIWVIDSGDIQALSADDGPGAAVTADELESRRSAAGLDDIATIIYTSGTTGPPRGCELTHGNFTVLAENATDILADVVARDHSSTLLFLPLAHVFARFIEVLAFSSGARMTHWSDPNTLLDGLALAQPTFFLSVPRMFEKIYNGAEQKAIAKKRGTLFARAAATAIEYSRAMDSGRIPLRLRLQHTLYDRLVYPKVRGVFGGKAEYAVSGGGPLGERLGHFFRGVGITILEGYGLTETSAPTTVNLPARTRVGSVGLALPGNSLRVDPETSEILIKGPHVFRRYHNNDEATEQAFDADGWFRSGDLGSIDEDGFVRITGRSKEILVTAGGKNVAPAVLEDQLRAHPLVSQCIVVGDGKPYIGALLTLDPEMLATWLSNENLPAMDVATAAADDRVRAALQSAVDAANKSVSKAESIRRFDVLVTDFTMDSGHLTPSMKLKRNLVMRDFQNDVDGLYRSDR